MGSNDGVSGAIVAGATAINIASLAHSAVKKAMMAKKTQMEQDDDALYELWDGVAGDNFRLASYVCEQSLLSLSVFNGSASEALKETGANFEFVDDELSKNIEVGTEGDG